MLTERQEAALAAFADQLIAENDAEAARVSRDTVLRDALAARDTARAEKLRKIEEDLAAYEEAVAVAEAAVRRG